MPGQAVNQYFIHIFETFCWDVNVQALGVQLISKLNNLKNKTRVSLKRKRAMGPEEVLEALKSAEVLESAWKEKNNKITQLEGELVDKNKQIKSKDFEIEELRTNIINQKPFKISNNYSQSF